MLGLEPLVRADLIIGLTMLVALLTDLDELPGVVIVACDVTDLLTCRLQPNFGSRWGSRLWQWSRAFDLLRSGEAVGEAGVHR